MEVDDLIKSYKKDLKAKKKYLITFKGYISIDYLIILETQIRNLKIVIKQLEKTT